MAEPTADPDFTPNYSHNNFCDSFFSYLVVWKHERIYMEEIWKSEEFVWNMWRIFFKKNEKLYGKMLNLVEKVKEFIWQKIGKVKNLVWKHEGFILKNEEFPWKNDEFVWTSERNYMVQRYSKYRFFDVNCILKFSKYRFSSSIPGMPGEAKISIPYSVWVEDLICIYIYIYICVVMSWGVLSVGVSTADW